MASPATRSPWGVKHKPTLSSIIYLKNVLCRNAIDSVSFFAVATDYFESAGVIEFRALIRREPVSHKLQASSILRDLAKHFPVDLTQSMDARANRKQRSLKPEHDRPM